MDAVTISPMVDQNGPSGRRATPPGRVCLGVITAPHGVGGEVRIKCFTERPEAIAAYAPLEDESGERRLELEVTGLVKGGVRARIAGCADRDQAEALRGVMIYVAREALPEPAPDEYYHADLEGLLVELADGSPVGTITAIYNFGGSSDILEIARPDDPHQPLLIPFTSETVPTVNIDGGRIIIDEEAIPTEGSADAASPDDEVRS